MTSSTELPRSLRWFIFASLSLTIASLGYSLTARLIGFGLPYSFPYYFSIGTFFSDFNELALRFRDLGSPAFFASGQYFMYPPAMVLPYGAVVRWLPDPFHTFILVFAASLIFFAICFYRVLRRYLGIGDAILLAASTAVTSYPFWLLVQRENMEVFAWILITVGLWSFYRERFTCAAICIGIATALKIYPLVFFGLFLPPRLYRQMLIGIGSCLAATIIGLRAMSPDIAFAYGWDKIQLQAFGRYYTTSWLGLGYDHSLFALVKVVTLPWLPNLDPLLSYYTWVVIIACLALYFGRIWKVPVVNRIIALSVLSVTIAPASHEYTLLSLYASLAILCVLAMEGSKLTPYLLLYAAILTPQSYAILRGARYCGPLHAVFLLALLGLSLCRPIAVVTGGVSEQVA